MQDSESFKHVETLFNEAMDQPVAKRRAFLDDACPDDPALRGQVERLISRAERGITMTPIELDSSREAMDEDRDDDLSGTTIDRFKILHRLGEGGFGDVYEARQFEPVNRLVALKIIKRGMDTRKVIARFEAERQALAMMDHPGIARVFDAGSTRDGRPYFVMELVREGRSITDYCNEHRLTMRQRFELFIQVCRAVQHAHQKGIIHRDLKPSNVLVMKLDG
ncbi:MAG: serine/threonine-protein kinase, partial [Planctomycetota bacterium]|nr:serine/threonine-protein kinase [Planctomycetota bacterium]